MTTAGDVAPDRQRAWYARAVGPLVAVAFGWFAVNLVHPVGPPALLWITTPLYGPLLFLVWRDASRRAALPAANRRFWRHLTVVALLVGAGHTVQAVDVVLRPDLPGPRTGPVLLCLDGVALIILIYALFRLPTGRQSRGDVLRIVLDATTVMLATAVFIWHSTDSQAGGTADTTLLSLSLMALASFGVFAVAKVLLSDVTVIDRTGLWLLTGAILVGALAPMLQPLVAAQDPRLFTVQVSIPLLFLLAARAGDGPRLLAATSRRAAGSRRRPYSVLPYVAVAAVDALLIRSYAAGDIHDLALLIGAAVALTGLVIARQMTAMRDNARLLEELDHTANHDALTHLPNRALFTRRLHQALGRAPEEPVAVALIDLDDFKMVNDTLGHDVGDALLIGVAGRLARCVGPHDTVARLGGDEFVVVLEGADAPAADRVIDRMIDALAAPVIVDGHELPIRASVGVADGRSGDDAGTLLRLADIAMYEAKKLDGTACLHFVPGMAAGGDGRLEGDIRPAIDNDELFLVYQPIVSLLDGRITGAEALVRWAHPRHGVLAPDLFVPPAERNGLIRDIDRWVIRTGLRQLDRWNEAHGHAGPLRLNINVSARHLREPDFAAGLAEQLTAHRIDPGQLTVEITETAVLHGAQTAVTLDDLRRLGVGISLDDFGTGYSTLSLLHECPATEIKLDRSFLPDASAGRRSIASTVLQIAESLNLHAVAEGVETAEQAERLRMLGYPAAQGHLFGEPMPAEEFAMLLGRSPAGAGPRTALRAGAATSRR